MKKPLSKKDSLEHKKNDFPLTWAKSSSLVLNLNKVNVALKTGVFTFLKSSSMRISSRSKNHFQKLKKGLIPSNLFFQMKTTIFMA